MNSCLKCNRKKFWFKIIHFLHLVAGFSIQAGSGDITGPIWAAGGKKDEVTGECLVLPDHNDVSNLTWEGHKGTILTYTLLMVYFWEEVCINNLKKKPSNILYFPLSGLGSCVTHDVSGAA